MRQGWERTASLFAAGAMMTFAPVAKAQPVDPHAAEATAAAVRAADVAFMAESRTSGLAAAFRDYMDETEGLSFGGPKPAQGSAAIYKIFGSGAPLPFTLEWVPTSAWGSRGGDMGVTTGDWRRTPKDPTKPIKTGRYVTVWRLNAQGQWKGLIDIGEVDDAPISNAVGSLPGS